MKDLHPVEGNHAIALSQAAAAVSRELQHIVPVYVVLPRFVSQHKMKMMQVRGATVIETCHASLEASKQDAYDLSTTRGLTFIHPSNSNDITNGQATTTFEFCRQVEELTQGSLDALIVPCGGGSLLAGSLAYAQDLSLKVLAASSSQGGSRLRQSLMSNQLLRCEESEFSIADGLRTSIGASHWESFRESLTAKEVFEVNDEQVVKALRFYLSFMGEPIEPSAAVSLAALMFNEELCEWVGKIDRPCKIGVILTGGNITMSQLRSLLG